MGNLTLNLSLDQLEFGGKNIRLGAKEFEIMKYLLTNQNQIVTKESLIVNVWSYDADIEDNNVEVYISFLRKKLQFLKANVKISTVRKVGYLLELLYEGYILIKKLKHKFIFIFMSLVTLVLLAVFFYIGVSTYTRLEQDCKLSLERSLEEPMQAPGNDPGNVKDNSDTNNKFTPNNNTAVDNDLTPTDNNNSREPAPINSSVVLVLKYTSDGRQIDSQKQHSTYILFRKRYCNFL